MFFQVMNKNGDFFDSIEDVPQRLTGKYIRPTMFPPSLENAKEYHLERW